MTLGFKNNVPVLLAKAPRTLSISNFCAPSTMILGILFKLTVSCARLSLEIKEGSVTTSLVLLSIQISSVLPSPFSLAFSSAYIASLGVTLVYCDSNFFSSSYLSLGLMTNS